MTRFANIYVCEQCRVPQGVKTLLAINGIECVEVDVSDDEPMRELICGKTGQGTLPVVELDGVFAAETNILVLAKTLGLRLMVSTREPPAACC
jgi:glutaredoxin